MNRAGQAVSALRVGIPLSQDRPGGMYDTIVFDAPYPVRQNSRMETNEVWRPILGFENYEVSSLGRVRTVPHDVYVERPDCKPYTKHISGRILRASFSSNSMKVSLHREGTKTSVGVTQVVAAAFLGPTPEGCVVACVDGNPRNTRLSNLAHWTRAEVEAKAFYTKPVGRPRKGAPRSAIAAQYAELARAHKRGKLVAQEGGRE